jgi:hypothetical protein
MNPLLVGRWRSYKIIDHGETRPYTDILLKFEPSGKVHYAFFDHTEKWQTDSVQRKISVENGKHYITEGNKPAYILPDISPDEIQFATRTIWGAPTVVTFLKRA